MKNMLLRERAARLPGIASLILCCTILTNTAGAQIGHQPSKSPYEDIKVGQEMSVFFGYFNSDVGAAGVLGKAAPFGGFRYDLPIGGPGFLTARYSFVPTDRTVVDPSKPRRTRVLGEEAANTHVVDLGLTVALTGRKAWHRLVPSLALGTGLAKNFAEVDTGGYSFGTKFAFTGGANLKYVLRNNWAVRVDATNYLWRNSYPDSYYAVASDTSAVLRPDVDKKSWKGTWGFSIGIAIPVFR